MQSVAIMKNSETEAGEATVTDHVDSGELHRIASQEARQVPAMDTTQPVSPGAAEGPEQRDEIVIAGAAEAQQPAAVRWMKPSDIKTAEPFSNLLPVNPKTRAAIAANMKTKGYDPASPVPFWEERGVAVDAHTRILAACDAGLEWIPVVAKSFASEDEAIRYAVHAQVDRRNLSDAERCSSWGSCGIWWWTRSGGA